MCLPFYQSASAPELFFPSHFQLPQFIHLPKVSAFFLMCRFEGNISVKHEICNKHVARRARYVQGNLIPFPGRVAGMFSIVALWRFSSKTIGMFPVDLYFTQKRCLFYLLLEIEAKSNLEQGIFNTVFF